MFTGANVIADAVPVPVRGTVCGLPGASSATLMLALCAPVLVGENFTPTLQPLPGVIAFAPSTHAVPLLGAPNVNCDAFAPVNVMPVMFSVAVPLLFIATLVTALLVPVRWFPNATLTGLNVTADAVPVPVRGTVCGLPGASSATLMLALCAPVLVGENFTPTLQPLPGVIAFAPSTHAVPLLGAPNVNCDAFAPVNVMPVMFSVAVPLLFIATLVTALLVPVRWFPNATLTGLNVTADAVPVPVRGTVCGLPGAWSATLMLALCAPVLVGENFTPTLQPLPGVIAFAPSTHA